MDQVKIKVCGMRETENIRELLLLQPDYMGFIFYRKSKRFVGGILSPKLVAEFPVSCKKTGVFVNPFMEEIELALEKYHLDAIQLHGNETPSVCSFVKSLGVEVIKAFSVDTDFDFDQLKKYQDVCDYFLFDTKGDSYGGNGITFDWQILKNEAIQKPFFLSGGIDPENIKDIENISPFLYAIDVNSKFELSPGLKDIQLLENTVFTTIRSL